MKYRYIDTQKAAHTVKDLCAVLGVPAASYFDWNRTGRALADARAARDAALAERLRGFHDESTGTYGSPRIHADCAEAGIVITRRKTAELMREHGIVGLSGREHATTTTRRDRMAAPFPDLVNRAFRPPAPDLVWYGDITYLWLDSRFWYLATVIDAHSKTVLGWALADHMRDELVVDALTMAVRRRGGRIPKGLIFHSDRGSQYTSTYFGILCRQFGIRQSMGRRGVCYDNAAAESFFATIKRELINRYHWTSIGNLRNGLFTWIETWYNTRRRHTTLGNRTPAQTEQQHRQLQQAS